MKKTTITRNEQISYEHAANAVAAAIVTETCLYPERDQSELLQEVLRNVCGDEGANAFASPNLPRLIAPALNSLNHAIYNAVRHFYVDGNPVYEVDEGLYEHLLEDARGRIKLMVPWLIEEFGSPRCPPHPNEPTGTPPVPG